MVTVFLGLGSNLGDKKGYIDRAITLLGKHPQVSPVRRASYYRTEPVGKVDQDWFLNTVIQVETDLKPVEVLRLANEIEEQLERTRQIHWGPRTIDIDILTYGQEEINVPDLTIPHREIKNRGFVLIPLLEIAPNYRFPSGEKAGEVLTTIIGKKGCLGVEKVL